MKNKVLVSFLVLFLGLSSLLLSDAIPVSRSLKSFRVGVAVQNLIPEGEITMPRGRLLIERRMDIETADYSDPGANNNHDPNAPSRV